MIEQKYSGSRRNSLTSISTTNSNLSSPASTNSPNSVRTLSTDQLMSLDGKFIKKNQRRSNSEVNFHKAQGTYYFPNGEVFRPRISPARRNKPGKIRPHPQHSQSHPQHPNQHPMQYQNQPQYQQFAPGPNGPVPVPMPVPMPGPMGHPGPGPGPGGPNYNGHMGPGPVPGPDPIPRTASMDSQSSMNMAQVPRSFSSSNVRNKNNLAQSLRSNRVDTPTNITLFQQHLNQQHQQHRPGQLPQQYSQQFQQFQQLQQTRPPQMANKAPPARSSPPPLQQPQLGHAPPMHNNPPRAVGPVTPTQTPQQQFASYQSYQFYQQQMNSNNSSTTSLKNLQSNNIIKNMVNFSNNSDNSIEVTPKSDSNLSSLSNYTLNRSTSNTPQTSVTTSVDEDKLDVYYNNSRPNSDNSRPNSDSNSRPNSDSSRHNSSSGSGDENLEILMEETNDSDSKPFGVQTPENTSVEHFSTPRNSMTPDIVENFATPMTSPVERTLDEIHKPQEDDISSISEYSSTHSQTDQRDKLGEPELRAPEVMPPYEFSNSSSVYSEQSSKDSFNNYDETVSIPDKAISRDNSSESIGRPETIDDRTPTRDITHESPGSPTPTRYSKPLPKSPPHTPEKSVAEPQTPEKTTRSYTLERASAKQTPDISAATNIPEKSPARPLQRPPVRVFENDDTTKITSNLYRESSNYSSDSAMSSRSSLDDSREDVDDLLDDYNSESPLSKSDIKYTANDHVEASNLGSPKGKEKSSLSSFESSFNQDDNFSPMSDNSNSPSSASSKNNASTVNASTVHENETSSNQGIMEKELESMPSPSLSNDDVFESRSIDSIQENGLDLQDGLDESKHPQTGPHLQEALGDVRPPDSMVSTPKTESSLDTLKGPHSEAVDEIDENQVEEKVQAPVEVPVEVPVEAKVEEKVEEEVKPKEANVEIDNAKVETEEEPSKPTESKPKPMLDVVPKKSMLDVVPKKSMLDVGPKKSMLDVGPKKSMLDVVEPKPSVVESKAEVNDTAKSSGAVDIPLDLTYDSPGKKAPSTPTKPKKKAPSGSPLVERVPNEEPEPETNFRNVLDKSLPSTPTPKTLKNTKSSSSLNGNAKRGIFKKMFNKKSYEGNSTGESSPRSSFNNSREDIKSVNSSHNNSVSESTTSTTSKFKKLAASKKNFSFKDLRISSLKNQEQPPPLPKLEVDKEDDKLEEMEPVLLSEELTLTKLPTIETEDNMFDDMMLTFDEKLDNVGRKSTVKHKPISITEPFLKDDELTIDQIQDQQLKDKHLNTHSRSNSDEYIDENLLYLKDELIWPIDQVDGKSMKSNKSNDERPLKFANTQEVPPPGVGGGEDVFYIDNEQLTNLFNNISDSQRRKLPMHLKYIKQFKDYNILEINIKKFETLTNTEVEIKDSKITSILKKRSNYGKEYTPDLRSRSRSKNYKKDRPVKNKVEFSNKISINETFAPDIYSRYNKSVTQYNLTEPIEITRIKNELNDYKCNEMLVHEQSQTNTHFFY